MNVLLVFTYGYSLKTWEEGGVLSREISIYEELSKKHNINFKFLTFGNEGDLEIQNKINFEVIPIYSFINKSKYKFINYLNSFFIPFRLKKEIGNNYDLIKQHQLLGSWISIILKFSISVPLYIRTGYDMYAFSKEMKKPKLTQFLYFLLTKISIYFSNLYSVSSKADFDLLNKSSNNKNIVIRTNWVLPTKNKKFDNRYENKILSVGRLEEQKNFSRLIELLKNSRFEIDIVGSGSKKNELINLANKNNVKIKILDNLNNSGLLSLMKKYKYFISTSLYEGNPKTIIEAMSCGCIVFASKIVNHSEIISHSTNGFLFNVESNELFELISNISKYDQLNISNNAIKHVDVNFSINKIAAIEKKDYVNLIV